MANVHPALVSIMERIDSEVAAGALNDKAAHSHRSALRAIGSALRPDETDIEAIDVDEVLARLSLSPSTRKNYKSRFNTIVHQAGRSATGRKRMPRAKPKPNGRKEPVAAAPMPTRRQASSGGSKQTFDFVIPIDENRAVEIKQIPYDLSPTEAQRIVNVLMALVS